MIQRNKAIYILLQKQNGFFFFSFNTDAGDKVQNEYNQEPRTAFSITEKTDSGMINSSSDMGVIVFVFIWI